MLFNIKNSTFSAIPPKLMKVCKRYTGLTLEQFNDLFNSLQCVDSFIRNHRTSTAALYMYLMKMRTGWPNQDIAIQFSVSETTTRRLISQMRSILKQDLVPYYVNYVRSREDLIEHNTEMSDSLFDPENKGVVMLVCDATYIFIDKSRNYIHQKKTFSGQKKRNFLKVMNVTTCDGTIVYSIGPFPAVQNDASILKYLLEETVIFDNLMQGDILLLDRGFRDVVSAVESKGLIVKMPALVQASTGRNGQLSTKEANRSRLVTALRFIVEIRNGHLKKIWKMFDRNWCSFAQLNLSVDVEICSALINKYYPTFSSNCCNAKEVSSRMMLKLDEENRVGAIVSKDNFQKHIKKFTRFNNFEELPTLTNKHLFLISLGYYPIKQAESYTQMHVKQNSNQFIIWECPMDICQKLFSSLFEDGRDPVLFMMKLNSRFRSNKTHTTYVLIERSAIDENAVIGHYCDCYNGMRTLGCCSHIMTLISFLLVSKGQDLVDPAGFLNHLFDDEY